MVFSQVTTLGMGWPPFLILLLKIKHILNEVLAQTAPLSEPIASYHWRLCSVVSLGGCSGSAMNGHTPSLGAFS